MSQKFKIILALMFFLSGMCSLVYQIVWIRLAYAHFGAILPVLSVSISVFMLGLGLGSWFGGKYIDILSKKTNIKSAYFYGFSEILIGTGAVLIPILFAFGQKLLLAAGQTNSVSYMCLSALFLALSILPWCIAMGTTYPFIMSFIRQTNNSEQTSFSFLYTANVLGSVFGVLGTVVFAIELFGLSNTLYIAGCTNLFIACCAFYAAKKFGTKKEEQNIEKAASINVSALWKIKPSYSFLKVVLFTTGFVSLGIEVAWTRAFSPALGTMVYAFSFLLAGYLLANYIGTCVYRSHVRKGKVFSLGFLLSVLAVTSFLPIIINDPNLLGQGRVHTVADYKVYKYLLQVVLTIFPVCTVLGYLTPSIIDYYSEGDAKKAGESYAINVLGCILGPLAVSYLMLPFMSAKAVMIIMSVLYVFLFLLNVKKTKKVLAVSTSVFLLAAIIMSVAYTTTYEIPYSKSFQKALKKPLFISRDTTATVVAYNGPEGSKLLVNGYGMTHFTTITKTMAHFPLALHGNAKNGLVICFGMGTTHRSMLSWDIDTTSVELTPGVVNAFPVFYNDAEEVVNNPKSSIIVDDGRRFLMRTGKKFDVITLDPPPPIQSSGSSFLYSREFYRLVKSKLNEGGILQHWIPFSFTDQSYNNYSTMRAILKTIDEEFNYVKIYLSVEKWGMHISASMSPIGEYSAKELSGRMPEKAQKDFCELLPDYTAEEIMDLLLVDLISKNTLLNGWNKREFITDSYPYSEYFLLREAELL